MTTTLQPGTDTAPEPAEATPRWPSAVGLSLSLLGLVDSAYLTYVHYTSVANFACPETGRVDCAKVTTSSYSHIAGVPVAVLGLLFFVGMVVVNVPAAWRSPWAPLRIARVAATVVGVGMILWLVYAELFQIHAICLYCTGVHILTVLLFVATVMGTISTASYSDDDL